MKEMMRRGFKPVMSAIGGVLLGLAVYYYVRCDSSSCLSLSNAAVPVLYFGMMGALSAGRLY